MRRHLTFALTAAAVASLAAGCGSESPSSDGGATAPKAVTFEGDGISFIAPAGWSVQRGTGNLVATAAAGDAAFVVWRYSRKEKLPQTKLELKAARDGLVDRLAAADEAFQRIKTAPTMVDGLPAVQIRAHETIAGKVRTVRSTHIYAYGSEIVVDAYAPDRTFRSVDAHAFRPLLRTLTIGAAQGAA